MKKIISLLASAALLVSSATAFAAVPADANPTATVKVEDTGVAGTGKNEGKEKYTLTVSLDNIGTVESGEEGAGTRLVQYELGIKGNVAMAGALKSNLEKAKAAKATMAANKFEGINVLFATTDPSQAYPTSGSTTKCDDTYVVTFWGVPGEDIEIYSGSAKLGYATFYYDDEETFGLLMTGDGTLYKELAYDQTKFTLPGGTPEETCATFAVDSVNKFDNGYVWTADLTKGTKDIASFKAKFEAGEAVAERAVKNVDVLNKFAGAGKVSFNIGLETKKELTKATFTVNDGDDHAVEAPVK